MSYPRKFHLFTARNTEGYAVESSRIACNDINLEGGKPFLWVIGNEYGVMGAVWASHDQDALDELVDQDLGAGILVDDKHVKEMEKDGFLDSLSNLGNAGEWADLQHAWLEKVVFKPDRDCKLMCAFAEARGASLDFLGDL